MIGCYRRDEAHDADIFATAMVAVFCEYSEAIVVRVTDPRTGVPGTSKWLPAMAEIRGACEAAARKIADLDQWQRRERAREIAPPRPEIDVEQRKAAMARIRARYPELYGTEDEPAHLGEMLVDALAEQSRSTPTTFSPRMRAKLGIPLEPVPGDDGFGLPEQTGD